MVWLTEPHAATTNLAIPYFLTYTSVIIKRDIWDPAFKKHVSPTDHTVILLFEI